MRRPQSFVKPSPKSGPLANDDISFDSLRLIDEKGTNLGVVSLAEAKRHASTAALDLIMVSSATTPPVARILDLGKHKYEQQKKRNHVRRNQKVTSIKEIKMRPFIDSHDYGIKVKAIKRFIDDGDKVKVTIRFRGRELANTGIGLDLINRVIEDTKSIGQVEQQPQFESRQFMAIIGKKAQ